MASIKDQVRVAYLHDGKDHVNVSAYGASECGRLSFPEWRRNFYIPHLGEFGSPRAFANWCVSGGQENLRRHTGFFEYRVTNIREFRALMLYAKFFQLTALRPSLTKEENLLDVPWLMYKKHLTGVREYHQWEDYPGIVKAFVTHIVRNGNQAKFDFEGAIPGVTEIVNRHLRAFIGEDFVGIEKIDEIRGSRKEQKRAEQKAARGESRSLQTVDETGFVDKSDAAENDQQPNANAHLKTTADALSTRERPVKQRFEGLPSDDAASVSETTDTLQSEARPLDTAEYESRAEQLHQGQTETPVTSEQAETA